jgi:hypothetical protein
MNNRINEYFSLQEEIYKYFGYEEDWVVIPLDDRRGMYWKIVGTEADGEVLFCEDGKFRDEDLFSNTIYTQRFLPKYVYRAPEFTMISVDTHTDGNKFLAIFSNDKEIK